MKINTTFLLVGVIPLLASCAAPPVALAPVGPGPFAGRASSVRTGYLQVFSSLEEQSDDQNQENSGASPFWYQHTDYNIYDPKGKLVEHVDNTAGHYSTSPRLVSLRPGNYAVSARIRSGSRSRCRWSSSAVERPKSIWMTTGSLPQARRKPKS